MNLSPRTLLAVGSVLVPLGAQMATLHVTLITILQILHTLTWHVLCQPTIQPTI